MNTAQATYLPVFIECISVRPGISFGSDKRETIEAVEYLQKRETFWEMLEIRKDKEAIIEHVESYRWLM